MILIATTLIANGGLSWRYDNRVASLASVLGYSPEKPFRAHQCFLDSGDTPKMFDRDVCLAESRSEPNVLLIGDSHAAHLWHGLQKVFGRTNLMQATAAICRPFFFKQQKILELQNIGEYLERCNLLMGFIYNDYLSHHHPDLIILAVRWDSEDKDGLAITLDWLRERRFAALLVGPDPNWNLPLPMLTALAASRHDPSIVERNLNTSPMFLDSELAVLAAAHGAKYFSIYGALCATEHCRTLDDNGLPLMFDYGHFTTEGSEIVAKQFSDPSLRQ